MNTKSEIKTKKLQLVMNLMRVFDKFYSMISVHNILINCVLCSIGCRYIENVM